MAPIQRSAIERVAAFNNAKHLNIKVPEISFGTPNRSWTENRASTFSDGSIIIDFDLCNRDFDRCLNDTLPHELAHSAVIQLYGSKYAVEVGHGPTWCDAYMALNGNPLYGKNACHN